MVTFSQRLKYCIGQAFFKKNCPHVQCIILDVFPQQQCYMVIFTASGNLKDIAESTIEQCYLPSTRAKRADALKLYGGSASAALEEEDGRPAKLRVPQAGSVATRADNAEACTSEYSPDRLITAIKARLGCRNYTELACVLEVGSPLLSKMRRRSCPLSAAFLIRAHEACGMEVAEMRIILGDRRRRFRV